MPRIYSASDFGGPSRGQATAAAAIQGLLQGVVAAAGVQAQRDQVAAQREADAKRNRIALRQLELQAEQENRIASTQTRELDLRERTLDQNRADTETDRAQREAQEQATRRLLLGRVFGAGAGAGAAGPEAQSGRAGNTNNANGFAGPAGPPMPGSASTNAPDGPALGLGGAGTDADLAGRLNGVTMDDLMTADTRALSAFVAGVEDERATAQANAAMLAQSQRVVQTVERWSLPPDQGGLGLSPQVGQSILLQLENGDVDGANAQLETIAGAAAEEQARALDRAQAFEGAKATLSQLPPGTPQHGAVSRVLVQAELMGWDAKTIRERVWESSAPDGARGPKPLKLDLPMGSMEVPVAFQPREAGQVLRWGANSAAERFFRLTGRAMLQRMQPRGQGDPFEPVAAELDQGELSMTAALLAEAAGWTIEDVNPLTEGLDPARMARVNAETRRRFGSRQSVEEPASDTTGPGRRLGARSVVAQGLANAGAGAGSAGPAAGGRGVPEPQALQREEPAPPLTPEARAARGPELVESMDPDAIAEARRVVGLARSLEKADEAAVAEAYRMLGRGASRLDIEALAEAIRG